MKEVGYARISTDKQVLDGQCEALLKIMPRGDIYADTCSGTIPAKERPGFTALMAAVKAGGVSTVVVYEFSRLGRSYADSVRTVLDLEDLNITVRSLSPKEAYISTCADKGMKRIMLTIALTSAERERDLLSERTKQGLVAARARLKVSGRELGRPTIPFNREFVEAEKARGQTHKQIAASLGMGVTTLWKRMNE
ncbi:recombinase family protein [Methanoregula sp.]|jgi:putative DNA-invertase from lambdoid prophage Rac|uniref:recombinase family protein n=1 Tax=Methanoregula sp. TaxID=2052170 RepID=UPI003C471B80